MTENKAPLHYLFVLNLRADGDIAIFFRFRFLDFRFYLKKNDRLNYFPF